MKRITLIFIIFIISFRVAYSQDKATLNNVSFSNYDKFSRIRLIFDKNTEYSISSNDQFVQVVFLNSQLANDFPAAEFLVKSNNIKRVIFKKNGNSGISLKVIINENSSYNEYFFKDSKSMIIDFYDLKLLSNFEKRFRTGLKYEHEGKYEDALKEYRKLVSENYINPELYYHAGLIRDSLGYIYQAKANYSLAKEKGNPFPDISYKLSKLYEKLNLPDKAKNEQREFKEKLLSLRKITIDSSIAQITKPTSLISMDSSSNIFDKDLDSNQLLATKQNSDYKNITGKQSKTKIVKVESINNDSYYYELAANIIVILVAICCVLSVYFILRKGNKRIDKTSKNKKKVNEKNIRTSSIDKINFDGFNLLNNEIANHNSPKKIFFDDYVLQYRKNDLPEAFDKVSVKAGPKIEDFEVKKRSTLSALQNIKKVNHKNQETIDISPVDNGIEKLAKKYQVEQEKIELALKLISKNTTESANEKYNMLIGMLKENLSIEELAVKLRIPRGEIDLLSNLHHI